MTKRTRLLAALGCALCAFALCLVYARSVRAEADESKRQALEAYGGEVVRVAVATQQLEVTETITESDVEMRDFLVDLVPEGAITKLEDVVGKSVTSPVAAGAVLCALSFRESGSSLAVPSGRVALTVMLSDKIGVPADIAPGTSLVAYALSDQESRLVSADVQVLAVRPRDNLSSVSTITLAVPPDDVAALLSCSVRENLRLVLPANDVLSLSAGPLSPMSSLAVEQPAPTSVLPVEDTAQDELEAHDATADPSENAEG